MFKEYNFYDFEEFTSCNKQTLTEMKREKNDVMVGFDTRKIILIYNIVLYYYFLQSETATKALAEEPTKQIIDDFKA